VEKGQDTDHIHKEEMDKKSKKKKKGFFKRKK